MSARVAIDLRMWSHPGIGRYTRELLEAMVGLRGHEDFRFLGYEKDLKLFLRQAPGASSTAVTSRIYSVGEQFEMARAAKNDALLHVPHFNVPVARKGKLVATIHDLIYLQDPKASKSPLGKSYASFLFGHIARKAAAVITVSEHTKNEVLNRFPRLGGRVHVTHEAASPLFRPIDDLEVKAGMRKKYALQKPFVLFVGSLKTHKNIPVLVDAMKELRHTRKLDIDLILVGRRDMKNEELWRFLQLNRSYARCMGELPDEDLAVFYNLASAFVLPSLREGFGLPVLEAMACGTPVVVSDRASLPEIAGSAALKFDPSRVDQLSSHLYRILTEEKLRLDLVAAGKDRAKEFSWEKTARKTWEVYERALA